MLRKAVQRPKGFTLIELIVVMMLMTTLLAITAPRLNDFMAGRTVSEEVRRLVSLTHLARSEAIARNERMELWINPQSGEYGLRSEKTEGEDAMQPKQFKLADKLSFRLDSDAELNDRGEAIALFWPDGTIDETSFPGFTLTEGEEPRRVIELADNRLEYLAQNPT